MWEEFTQSIHNFTEDKRNLAQQAQGKKKATIILIPSIRFTKLIIFHLQRLHNFHPRPESPLHLPTEEPVLGNLKFSAKGTKREVFGMTIPNELINDVIRGADYYEAYLNKVAKHQRYLAGEEVSDPDSPAPKPAKPTKQTKPKPTKQSKPTEPKAASKKPKQAPAKPQEKKRKPVLESSDAPPLAKRAKAGKVVKKRTAKSSKQLVDEFIDEGVPAAKPRLEDTEEEILEKVLQESLTDLPNSKGVPPSLVFRETDIGNFNHYKCQEKEREKVDGERSLMYKCLQWLEVVSRRRPQARPDLWNLKANVDEQVIQKNLSVHRDAYTEAESMVSVTIQQDISVIPPMTSPVIGPVPRPDSPNVHGPLPTTTTTTVATTTTTFHRPPQPQQGAIRSILHQRDETKKKVSKISLNTPPVNSTLHHHLLPQPTVSRIKGFLTTRASDFSQAPPPATSIPSTHQRMSVNKHRGHQCSSKTASFQAEYTAWTTTATWINPQSQRFLQ
ncbi:hypothetical protein Tco_1318193 [Tanacetum coccineum]